MLPDDLLRNVLSELPEYLVAQLRTMNTDFNRVGQTVHTEFQEAMSGKTNEIVNDRLFQRESFDQNIGYWSRVFASVHTHNTLKDAIRREMLRKIQVVPPTQGLTNEQERIVHTTPRGNVVVVQAYAGTGKTTTLFHYAKTWTQHKILYLAYNKVLADESSERFKDLPHVTVTTIHALAKKNYEAMTNTKLQNVGNIGIKDLLKENLTPEQARRLLYDFECFCASDQTTCTQPDVLRLLTQYSKTTHDAYLKRYQMLRPTLDYDVIMLDEVQDCTDCILDIVIRQKATRLFVGDVYQKIYGFRHVDNPFQYIVEKVPNARCFYLSVAFRFGYDLMHFTNLFLQKKYNEPRGFSKTRVLNTRMTYDRTLYPGMVVICRYNITAIRLLFEMEHTCSVVGKQINFSKEIQFAQDLWFLSQNQHDQIVSPKVSCYETLEKLQEFHNSTQNTKWKNRIQLVAMYGADTANQWRDAQQRYSEGQGVRVVTAHQSKGSEYDHVWIADDFNGSTEDAHNTLYVAMTRAQKTLSISPSLMRFYEKHTPKLRYPFDTKVSSRASRCTSCRKRMTNRTVCTEDDPVSTLQGKDCAVFTYVPVCADCH
jgi:hypothetical protein